MRIKKMSVSKIILLLIFLNLFQFIGYVSVWPRLTVVAIPNEATAVAYARTLLRAWDIFVEGYVFTSEFSVRSRGWIVTISPEDNLSERIHVIGFTALRGWNTYFDINWDLLDEAQ